MFFKYGAVERAQRTHAEEFYSLRFDERGGSTNSRGALLTGLLEGGSELAASVHLQGADG